jgi:hypothetical protein
MTESKVVAKTARSAGDIAVDGLLRGVIAGLAMSAVLVAAGLLARLPAQFVLSRFDPTSSGAVLPGLLAHLATAGIYGVLFALLTAPVADRLGSRMILAGLAYGVILLAVSKGLMASELGAPLRALPAPGWALAHLAYGTVLGWLLVRR